MRISHFAHPYLTIRGGTSKQKLTWKKMFKTFWLSLIDPSNVDSMLNEDKKVASSNKPFMKEKSSMFSSTKFKGKSLQ
jgi:hypothetical protein